MKRFKTMRFDVKAIADRYFAEQNKRLGRLPKRKVQS